MGLRASTLVSNRSACIPFRMIDEITHWDLTVLKICDVLPAFGVLA